MKAKLDLTLYDDSGNEIECYLKPFLEIETPDFTLNKDAEWFDKTNPYVFARLETRVI